MSKQTIKRQTILRGCILSILCIIGIVMAVYVGTAMKHSDAGTPQEPITRYYGNCHTETDLLIYTF